MLGCNTQSNNPIQPNNISSVNAKTSFEQHLLPILTARCAYSGCHDANGPHDLDFRSYQTFISSAEREDVFVPGNSQSSEIIEEIDSGRMPPDGHGPSLTAAEIKLFRDWINQQKPADFPNIRYEEDDNDDHDHDDHDHD